MPSPRQTIEGRVCEAPRASFVLHPTLLMMAAARNLSVDLAPGVALVETIAVSRETGVGAVMMFATRPVRPLAGGLSKCLLKSSARKSAGDEAGARDP